MITEGLDKLDFIVLEFSYNQSPLKAIYHKLIKL